MNKNAFKLILVFLNGIFWKILNINLNIIILNKERKKSDVLKKNSNIFLKKIVKKHKPKGGVGVAPIKLVGPYSMKCLIKKNLPLLIMSQCIYENFITCRALYMTQRCIYIYK
jgi:hypothetical protein